MSRQTFVVLCSELRPYLIRKRSQFRLPVPVDQQVSVTLWRLATNVEYQTIAALFGLGVSPFRSFLRGIVLAGTGVPWWTMGGGGGYLATNPLL